MKLFTVKQIAEIDKFTIENEPIKSIDLMERAAQRLFDYLFYEDINFITSSVCIVCGHGNNGGDGLALARHLIKKGKASGLSVFLFAEKDKLSPDCSKNLKRLEKLYHKEKVHLTISFNPEDFEYKGEEIIIDALFGSGLNRPLDGPYKTLIRKINETGATIYSIDIPSGLMGEDNRYNDADAIIQADEVLTLEFPKLSFFFPENERFVKNFRLISIDLHPEIKEKLPSPYYYVDFKFVENKLKKNFLHHIIM